MQSTASVVELMTVTMTQQTWAPTCHSWCAHRGGETDEPERCRMPQREQRQEWMDRYDAVLSFASQSHNLQQCSKCDTDSNVQQHENDHKPWKYCLSNIHNTDGDRDGTKCSNTNSSCSLITTHFALLCCTHCLGLYLRTVLKSTSLTVFKSPLKTSLSDLAFSH